MMRNMLREKRCIMLRGERRLPEPRDAARGGDGRDSGLDLPDLCSTCRTVSNLSRVAWLGINPYDAVMRWLLHGNLNPSVGEALHRHKHETRTPTDIGLAPDATADEVLRAAHKNQLDLLTRDQEVATALYTDPFAFDRSIVLLNVGEGDVEQDDAIDRLFARYRQLTPRRLYSVTEARVKVRQLPRKP